MIKGWNKMDYKREYKKYLTSSVLDTTNNKIASTSFISAFAFIPFLSNDINIRTILFLYLLLYMQ